MADENGEAQVNEAQLQEAKSLGWSDKDQWRGKPEDWVDAPTFLERGRQVLPIVRATNERLKGELGQTNMRLTSLEAELQASRATIAALEEAHEADTQAQVEAAREELRLELEQASRDGDHKAVADITQKMTELATAKPPEKKEKKEEKPAPQLSPDIVQWYKDNPEFVQNPRRVALANVVGAELRAAGETAVGAKFLDLVAAEVEKEVGKPAGRRTAGKVEGGGGGSGNGGSGSGSGGKTYSDLPAEAKAACDKQALRLVGPNRAHKDVASWRASYTKQYFGDQS